MIAQVCSVNKTFMNVSKIARGDNRVIFDASKECFNVLHTADGEGETFKFLGVLADSILIMEPGISSILSRTKPKVTAMLRPVCL